MKNIYNVFVLVLLVVTLSSCNDNFECEVGEPRDGQCVITSLTDLYRDNIFSVTTIDSTIEQHGEDDITGNFLKFTFVTSEINRTDNIITTVERSLDYGFEFHFNSIDLDVEKVYRLTIEGEVRFDGDILIFEDCVILDQELITITSLF